MFGGGSEVMFWEPQNSSLHHKGGEILLPTVAENECTNYKHHIDYKREWKIGELQGNKFYGSIQ